ncbi:hypothetical protein KPL74_10885 [Bacillus sp. NP157]|nr:hypothetical protein KPL74_10885 [Bacillus sp. NP157]
MSQSKLVFEIASVKASGSAYRDGQPLDFHDVELRMLSIKPLPLDGNIPLSIQKASGRLTMGGTFAAVTYWHGASALTVDIPVAPGAFARIRDHRAVVTINVTLDRLIDSSETLMGIATSELTYSEQKSP